MRTNTPRQSTPGPHPIQISDRTSRGETSNRPPAMTAAGTRSTAAVTDWTASETIGSAAGAQRFCSTVPAEAPALLHHGPAAEPRHRHQSHEHAGARARGAELRGEADRDARDADREPGP